MGHPQPQTPIQPDNLTAEGVINSWVRPKRAKLMDMQIDWFLDRQQQGQFKIYWKPGKTNIADYFTKHHPPAHHQNVQGELLTCVAELQKLRQEQAKDMETSLAMTDRIVFLKCSARVC
jgi:hypothetical protein